MLRNNVPSEAVSRLADNNNRAIHDIGNQPQLLEITSTIDHPLNDNLGKDIQTFPRRLGAIPGNPSPSHGPLSPENPQIFPPTLNHLLQNEKKKNASRSKLKEKGEKNRREVKK